MRQFSAEEIQDKFETLPKELQDAVTSPDINNKIQEIGARHELHIDQIGELVDQIGLVMLGLEKSSNFVTDTSARLSIGPKEAKAIADDINKEIFSIIREKMRDIEEGTEKEAATAETAISSVERAGGFTIEKEDSDSRNLNGVSDNDKADILMNIEHPPASKESTQTVSENHIEPLVDQLLGAATARPVQQASHSAEAAPPPNLPVETEPEPKPGAPKPKGPDPYRETFQ